VLFAIHSIRRCSLSARLSRPRQPPTLCHWSSVDRDILMWGADLVVDDFRFLDMKRKRRKINNNEIRCRRWTPIHVHDGEDEVELVQHSQKKGSRARTTRSKYGYNTTRTLAHWLMLVLWTLGVHDIIARIYIKLCYMCWILINFGYLLTTTEIGDIYLNAGPKDHTTDPTSTGKVYSIKNL
jgi:hypothetical protein